MPTALPILYSFRRCPYAMRARMALLASKTPVELREVVLRDKPSQMIEASPKGTVPVLVLLDGSVVDESIDVMHWALSQNDPAAWAVGSDEEADLIARNDGPFKAALDRYKYPNRYPEENIDPQVQRVKASEVLADYEQRLAEQPFLMGDQPSLADNAIFPFVRQFANVDRAWFDAQPWHNLHHWLEHFLTSAPFEDAMRKFDQWQPGDAPLIFAD